MKKFARYLAKLLIATMVLLVVTLNVPLEGIVEAARQYLADHNVVDKVYLAVRDKNVVDNFRLGTKEAHANPGLRAKTVEYFLYQYDSSATNLTDDPATPYLSPGTVVNLPESTVTVISAYVDFKVQSGGLSTAMDAFTLRFGRVAGACGAPTMNTRASASGLTAPVADGSESKMIDLRADVTADFSGYTGGSDQCVKFDWNLSMDMGALDTTAEATFQGASAKLIITYTYDDTSATQLNTIYYPLEIATNQGTKAAQLAASTSADFTYTTTAPELTAAGNLKNQFFEVNMRAGNSATTTDASYNFCRFYSAACGTYTGLHYFEEALSRNAAGTRYLVDALSGFVYNDSGAALRVTNSASTVANFLGGTNIMTYSYLNSAATKTKTVKYSVGEVITAAGSGTKSALVGPTVILREGGIAVQKAWFRIETSSSAADSVQVTTKVGANVETTADANDLYAFAANTIEAGQANYINHIIPSADYAAINSGALSGVAVQMTADWTTGGGSVSAELYITYTYTDLTTGWTDTRAHFAGQQQVNGATTMTALPSANGINPAIPDTGGTVAIQSQWIHMQQVSSLATVVANQARGLELTTAASCTPAAENSTGETTALAYNLALYRTTGSILTNSDATTYTACYKSTTSSELSLFNGALYYTVSVSITPAASLAISVTAGAKITVLNSGDTSQYAHDPACTGAANCAAFAMAASGGTVTVTSIKITETGTTAANTNLANPTI
ncbi:MAG: hypothetical protein HY974_00845, partial [Candidatus Kerfeldbacteria bacterium]|nr:hypothetical protein [Candidatus Kerfeldbacteria bacterium]